VNVEFKRTFDLTHTDQVTAFRVLQLANGGFDRAVHRPDRTGTISLVKRIDSVDKAIGFIGTA